MKKKQNAQIIYLSHGGGPLPLLNDPEHQKMIDFFRHLPALIRKPDAVVVISAHWEENRATLLGSERPPMLYDYYGFPEEAYSISYPAPGHPSLAKRIQRELVKQGHESRIDSVRGFDHGLFIPLLMAFPEADVPAIQLSLLKNLDPESHIRLGESLRPFLDENILVIGSGFSFHNMREFFQRNGNLPDPKNDLFQEWLIETCSYKAKLNEQFPRLIGWENASHARYCHPREEHLLPLHVCAGMADAPGKIVFDDYIAGKRSIAVLWR